VFVAEATLQHDDLGGHAKLAGRVQTRIGGAEFAATAAECASGSNGGAWMRSNRTSAGAAG
jgi:hypothetical protein